jgi:hypothetical protein
MAEFMKVRVQVWTLKVLGLISLEPKPHQEASLKYFFLKSDSPKTIFAPEWNYIFGEKLIVNIDLEHIAKLVLSKRYTILKDTKLPENLMDGNTGLGPYSLTSRFLQFNVFEWDDPEILKLFTAIQDSYKQFLKDHNIERKNTYVQCWANVLNETEEIKIHNHATHEYSFLSGNFCVRANNTHTVYVDPINYFGSKQSVISDNQAGMLNIFQSCVPHFTTPNNDKLERITIAFDIILEESFDRYPNKGVLVEFDKVERS